MTTHTSISVWVVDDDSSIRWVLEKVFLKAHITVQLFERATDLLDNLATNQPDVILTDIRMPEMDGLSLLEKIHQAHPHLPVIIITAHSDLESTVASYSKGAFDYLAKPFDIDKVLTVVKKAARISQKKIVSKTTRISDLQSTTGIIGQSQAMQRVFRIIGRLVNSSMNVLITGESGTGKELVAKALHQHSPRRNQPFIALNTAAIPKELLEAELFGHEKGAFTGAHNLRKGRFEEADKGTLFLDEIGDMPAEMQTRLLRVLAEGEFYRVGGCNMIHVDVRIIAATHQDLEERIQQKLFRADLYHRLNVIQIHIPPLRERIDDIPLLLKHFSQKIALKENCSPRQIPANVIETLCHYPWPGNIRQLENLCQWLTLMVTGYEITLDDLPKQYLSSPSSINTAFSTSWKSALEKHTQTLCEDKKLPLIEQLMPEFEQIVINVALQRASGKKAEAARIIGWGRNTLTRKINELKS